MPQLNFRRVFWGGAVLIIGALFVVALIPQPVPVDLAEIRNGPMAVSIRDEGYSRIRDVYAVAAPVGGRLLRVEREPGDRVEPGDVLARIVPVSPAMLDARSEQAARAALSSAQAALDFARADLERARAERGLAATEADRAARLLESGTLAQEGFDRASVALRSARAAEQTARAAVRMREAEIEAAQAQLLRVEEGENVTGDLLEVRAPAVGQVLQLHQESETTLMAGTAILDMGDPYGLEIVAEILSEDAVQIDAGARAIIHEWGEDDAVLRGRVRLVEPFGFEEVSALGVREQRVNVIIDLMDEEEVWRGLGHGFRIEAEIVLWESEDVLQVPVSALFRFEGDWACFVEERGRARLRRVEIGRDNGVTAEVLAGLGAGEQVILYASDAVSEGVRLAQRDPG